MRGITLWQPYATLVAIEAKMIETRSWGTTYRGPLLIHAARKWDLDVEDDCRRAAEVLGAAGWPRPARALFAAGAEALFGVRGHALAVANLVDCRPMPTSPEGLNGAFGTFGPGRYGWVLADVVPLDPPVPWRGMQGLWPVSSELAARVRGAMTREVKYVR